MRAGPAGPGALAHTPTPAGTIDAIQTARNTGPACALTLPAAVKVTGAGGPPDIHLDGGWTRACASPVNVAMGFDDIHVGSPGG